MSYLQISTQFELKALENSIFDMLLSYNLYFVRDTHHCEHADKFNILWEGNDPSIRIIKFRLNLLNDINILCQVFSHNYGVNKTANTTCPICDQCTI